MEYEREDPTVRTGLLERAAEHEIIEGALAGLRRGGSALVVFEGVTGIGKTSLLEALRRHAAAGTPRVLHARGGEFEGGFCFGVVRQLIEPWLMTAPAEERSAVLTAGARLAAPLFDYDGDGLGRFQYGAADDAPAFHGLLHGLHWLCVNLAERTPLVIVIDDAQWCDLPSLHFLSYLTSRLDRAPIFLAVAQTTSEPGPGADLIYGIASSPLARLVRPAPLSAAATAELVAAELDRKPAPRFTLACHRLTDGNPMFLRELVDELRQDRVEPTDAQADRVAEITPSGVRRYVKRRLDGLRPDAVDLARALAGITMITHGGADLRHAAAVAEIDEARAAEAVGPLAEAGLLRPGAGLEFVEPVIGNAVHHGMSLSALDRLHRRIARLALAAPASETAAHLRWVQPASDPWVVMVLRAAAREAHDAGDTGAAVAFLRRALAEPPEAELLPRVRAELGAAELRDRRPEAVADLEEALQSVSGPVERAGVGLNLARALMASARYDEAIELLTRLAVEVEPHDEEQALRLQLQIVDGLRMSRGQLVGEEELIARIGAWTAGSRTVRGIVRAQLAYESLTQGAPAAAVVPRAESVLLEGPSLSRPNDGDLDGQILAAWVLALCDRLPDAERALEAAQRYAADHGLTDAVETATALRALTCYDLGMLDDAEAAARSVLRRDVPGALRGPGVPLATTALVDTLIEREALDAADEELRRFGLRDEGPNSVLLAAVLGARGRLRIAQGQAEEGLWDLLEYRRHAAPLRGGARTVVDSPAATLALARFGLRDEAETLAVEDLEHARIFGGPRQLAVALRTAGLLAGGAKGLGMLEESARLLADSPAVLERARTLIHLGGALRRADQRSAARRHLGAGVELAERCGAVALRRMADAELLATGVRTRRGSSHAPPLTPRERHVAGMAADGMRNQEIAHTLFVTVKTVEWHLSQAYRKLGIGSRAELQHALAASSGLDRRR